MNEIIAVVEHPTDSYRDITLETRDVVTYFPDHDVVEVLREKRDGDRWVPLEIMWYGKPETFLALADQVRAKLSPRFEGPA